MYVPAHAEVQDKPGTVSGPYFYTIRSHARPHAHAHAHAHAHREEKHEDPEAEVVSSRPGLWLYQDQGVSAVEHISKTGRCLLLLPLVLREEVCARSIRRVNRV